MGVSLSDPPRTLRERVNTMKSFYVEMQRSGWLRGIIMAALGAWLLLSPRAVFGVIVNVVAGVLLVMGIMSLISGARVRRAGGANIGVGSGVGLIVAAFLVEIFAGVFISMFPFISGILLIIYGISSIGGASASRQYVNVSNASGVIYGVLVIIAGIVLMFNPFGSMMLLLRVFGGMLVVMGVMEFINSFRYRA